jgi:three-Cys-motif partner protein
MAGMDASLVDDGLVIPEAGGWARTKYALIRSYCQQFATGMKNKWDCRVYIDLFAGAGLVRLRDSGEIVKSSALLALDIPDPFDQHIFCDMDREKLGALDKRIKRWHPDARVTYISGDANACIAEVLKTIPQFNKDYKVLAFCLVDPYCLSQLRFNTIRTIADRFVDFMVLLATDMDARRNVVTYCQKGNTTVQEFLGMPDWRQAWADAERQKVSFGLFVAREFGKQMAAMGYQEVEVQDSVLVRNSQKNAPLYRLAFYSRHPLGIKFWKQAKNFSDPQMTFDLGV